MLAAAVSIQINTIDGKSAVIELPEDATMYKVHSKIFEAFGIPCMEQTICIDSSRPEEAYELCGSGLQTLAEVGVVPGMSFTLLRQDKRSTSEKTGQLIEALNQQHLAGAAALLRSSGSPVDPNCVYRHPGWPKRDDAWRDENFMSCTWPALCLAVFALKQWRYVNEVDDLMSRSWSNYFLKAVGEGVPEPVVLEVVELLVSAGASVDASGCDTISNLSSWPIYRWGRTPLYIAVEAGSTKIVQLLLDAGANPDVGYTLESMPHPERAPDVKSCNHALSSIIDAGVRKDIELLFAAAKKAKRGGKQNVGSEA
jgi:hypothetical protein